MQDLKHFIENLNLLCKASWELKKTVILSLSKVGNFQHDGITHYNIFVFSEKHIQL